MSSTSSYTLEALLEATRQPQQVGATGAHDRHVVAVAVLGQQRLGLHQQPLGVGQIAARARGAPEQPQRVAAAAQVAGRAQDLDRLARALRRLRVAAGAELVVQHAESIQVPALGARVRQPARGLDRAVEQHQALRPRAAERKHVAQAVRQVQDRLVEDGAGRVGVAVARLARCSASTMAMMLGSSRSSRPNERQFGRRAAPRLGQRRRSAAARRASARRSAPGASGRWARTKLRVTACSS